MRKTPVDLYRMGNAISSRMENIRVKDIDIYESDGKMWVAANSGGISTFSIRGSGKNCTNSFDYTCCSGFLRNRNFLIGTTGLKSQVGHNFWSVEKY